MCIAYIIDAAGFEHGHKLRLTLVNVEVRKSGVAKPSYETELHKMKSHFELLTRKFL